MKLLIRIILAIVSLAVLYVVLFVGSLMVGDRIARGPISEIHAQIEPGMTRTEVVEIYRQNPEVIDWGSGSIMQLSHPSNNITSPIVGSWLCMAKIHLDGDVVKTVDDVFCVD